MLWEELKDQVEKLVDVGFTAVWLPPASKGNHGGYDTGYSLYDLFDLGEFDQKGSVRTKYGTKDEYIALVQSAKKIGLHIYADAIFCSKFGGDSTEEFEAIPFHINDYSHPIRDGQSIKSWTEFDFPSRGDTYSSMRWHWWHFSLVSYNSYDPGELATYLVAGKHLNHLVKQTTAARIYRSLPDFFFGCYVDFESDEVCDEFMRWGCWFLDTARVDGFRFSIAERIPPKFIQDWLNYVTRYIDRSLFAVGDFWSKEINSLLNYIHEASHLVSLFDVPLHYNFHDASRSDNNYDMRYILDGTLMQQSPTHAVTFVENHDSQPLQSLESVVETWFKPLAYAIILLRQEGYPCVFYPDYYGAHYTDKGEDGNEYEIQMDSHKWIIDRFLFARKNFVYGNQYNYFDHHSVIGWTCLGNTEHPKAIAVIMSNGAEGSKWMEVGKPNTKFVDLIEGVEEPVYTNEVGWGEFYCKGGSVSVWIEHE